MENKKINVGLVGMGLNTYWSQFEGLYERLCKYQKKIADSLTRPDISIINAGILDRPEEAKNIADVLSHENIEVLFVYISTYALSSTVLPLAQRLKVPIILLNIQPSSHIDYTYIRSDLPFKIVTGYLEDNATWTELNDWLDATVVMAGMREHRMGILGHYYCGMLDVYSDISQQSSSFGTHIELLEMCELKAYRDVASDLEIKKKIMEFQRKFEVVAECEETELIRAARTSVALDKLIKSHQLGSMAYYYEGYPGNDYEDIVTSVIAGNTLLTGKNIPIAGECEVKNVQAMKILSLLKAGGSFSEFYAMDFKDDVILLGHDGPAHFAMSDGKVKLVPLPVYHGKPGKGLSIQMTVKNGPVTLLSVCEGKEGIFLLVAEGESVPGPVLEIGNTNSRYRFSCGVKSFMENWSKAGPSHHCAIGIGHLASKLEKTGFLLNIPVIKIA